MNPRTKILLIALFGCLTVAGRAAAQDPSLSIHYMPNLDYQSYSSDQPVSVEKTFTVAKNGQGAVSFLIMADGGQANSFNPRYAAGPGGDEIEYYLYDNLSDQNVLMEGPNVAPENVITGSFGASSYYDSVDRTYAVYIPAGQFGTNDTYTDEVTFTLYEGTLENYDASTAKSYTATINIIPERSISVVITEPGAGYDTGSRDYTLNFGELAEGKREELDLHVLSSVTYTVAFSSANNGTLAREAGGSDVPYTFSIDGESVDLSDGYSTPLTEQSPTSGGPREYRMAFEIGALGTAIEGDYQESITIEIYGQ